MRVCVQLIILVVLSMLTLESDIVPGPLRIAGVCVALLAIFWYSWFKLQEAPKPKADDATKETGGGDKTAPLAEADAEKGSKPTEATALIQEKEGARAGGCVVS